MLTQNLNSCIDLVRRIRNIGCTWEELSYIPSCVFNRHKTHTRMLLLSPIMNVETFFIYLSFIENKRFFSFGFNLESPHKFLGTVNGKSLDFWELCIPSHSLVVMTQLSPTLSFSILMMNMNCLVANTSFIYFFQFSV